jgi:hypothetical protein
MTGFLRQAVQNCAGPVGAAIVHRDHFQSRVCVCEDRSDGSSGVFSFVAGRNDDGDRCGASAAAIGATSASRTIRLLPIQMSIAARK